MYYAATVDGNSQSWHNMTFKATIDKCSIVSPLKDT